MKSGVLQELPHLVDDEKHAVTLRARVLAEALEQIDNFRFRHFPRGVLLRVGLDFGNEGRGPPLADELPHGAQHGLGELLADRLSAAGDHQWV